MFALLAQRNFALLWIAHTATILGDYVFFIGITFWIYERTGSASATGAVLIVSAAPAFLFAPLAGSLVDRWDRRRVMLAAECARAMLFLGLLGSVVFQAQTLWPIYAVGFVQSALAAFFWPARSALLPQLIEPSSLLAGNALYAVSDGGARIAAPMLSALALVRLGPAGVVMLDVASFVISVGGIGLLTPPSKPQMGGASSADIGLSAARLAEAVQPRELARRLLRPGVRATGAWRLHPANTATSGVFGLLLLGALVGYTAGTLGVLLPIFVRTVLSAGPLAYGWMFTTQAIGEGGVSVFLGRTPPRPGQAKDIRYVSGGLALGGIALILIASLRALASGLLLMMLFGMAMATISVHLMTLLQRRVANRALGRILANYAAVQALGQVGGMAVASIMCGRIGVQRLLLLGGALCLLGGGIAWLRLMRVWPQRSGNAPP